MYLQSPSTHNSTFISPLSPPPTSISSRFQINYNIYFDFLFFNLNSISLIHRGLRIILSCFFSFNIHLLPHPSKEAELSSNDVISLRQNPATVLADCSPKLPFFAFFSFFLAFSCLHCFY